jgi:2-succinyl-6-hydroxy-2,4-cyclohexadiene-1-carboxylate synthase
MVNQHSRAGGGGGVRTYRIAIDGDLVVADARGEAHQEAVLLLHGFTGDRTVWDEVARELAATHRVVVTDLPGHGDTRVRDEAGRHAMSHTCRLLEGVAAALAIERCTVVGYSMGGRLALHAALELPHLVERLILESASPGLATEQERGARREADEELARFVETSPIEAFVDRWEALPLFATQRALPADARSRIRRRRLACDRRSLAASLREMGTGAQAWLGDRLAQVSAPVLLIAGERDARFAGIARDMLRSLPDARLCVIPGAGHDVHTEAPADFLHVVRDFLQQGEHRCRSSG